MDAITRSERERRGRGEEGGGLSLARRRKKRRGEENTEVDRERIGEET